ncbi:Modification methylase XorII [Hyella patelloides LEGE 07179]|uniref:Cytosine-specific methyltransferase n=1 Tax=Hyella patelloides LEGE 07179 TaxID=945734 RepID=A0A563VVQ7_9CYAN|nr:DNA cytosine methyltransferase [Hyella patelloides]VEP15522.1 Modification methylase XorII [Hyella patelloides LEGE 07179]
MSERPLAIDLFSGCGGMSLGLEAAGFDIVASVEIDPIHSLIHHYNFPYGATICQDIAQLSSQELLEAVKNQGFGSRIDLIAGGPPCQGFSTMGKRQVDDPRNQLIFEYVRIVSEIKPKYFILENVPGMKTNKYQPLLQEFVKQFDNYGYSVIQPIQVLDASLYGAPQKRKRLIILGYRHDVLPLKYPDYTNLNTNQSAVFKSVRVAIDDLSKIPVFIGQDYGVENSKLNYSQSRKSFATQPKGVYALCHQRARTNLVWGHLGSKHTETSIKRFAATIPGKKEKISHFFKLAPDGLSNTLRAGTSRNRGAHTAPRPIHYQLPRCISIREAARLHTFPDWFQFHRTIWHGFREIGNAVIPLLAKHLGTEIINHLDVDLSSLEIKKLQPIDSALLSYKMEQAANFWQVDSEVIPKRKQNK